MKLFICRLFAGIAVLAPLDGATISVQAVSGPGLNVSGTASVVFTVISPASISFTTTTTGLGCTPSSPNSPYCYSFYNTAGQLSGIGSGAHNSVEQLSGSGANITPFSVCNGSASNNISCSPFTLDPGSYTLTAGFAIASAVLAPISSGSVTASVTLQSGGPIVAAPEPETYNLLAFGSIAFFAAHRRCRNAIKTSFRGFWSRSDT